jgi:phospholipid/cholesterol/gamma-HCH transport system substrate-binding protein
LEIRASYLLVGSVILVLLAGLAAFSVWLVKADVDQTVRYEIGFEGSVTGLQEGGQVSYRGVPVGRVSDIRLSPDHLEEVLVTVELEPGTPIRQNTFATLELQGITGIAYVQLRGGTQGSPPLIADPDAAPPRIPSRRSALEQVFESGPELLTEGLALVGRMTRLLRAENMAAVDAVLHNAETFTAALAAQSEDLGNVVSSTAGAAEQVEDASGELAALATDLRALTDRVGERVDGVGGDLVTTLAELQTAATALAAAADELDGLIGDVRQPVDDFAASGLYDFSQLIAETRSLVSALSRITTEFERDPTGFLLGSGQRGFQAE